MTCACMRALLFALANGHLLGCLLVRPVSGVDAPVRADLSFRSMFSGRIRTHKAISGSPTCKRAQLDREHRAGCHKRLTTFRMSHRICEDSAFSAGGSLSACADQPATQPTTVPFWVWACQTLWPNQIHDGSTAVHLS